MKEDFLKQLENIEPEYYQGQLEQSESKINEYKYMIEDIEEGLKDE